MGALQTSFDFNAPVPALSVEQQLQQLLGDRLGCRIAVTWTDNARIMVSARKRGAVTCVRLHHMFTEADLDTLRAVARFLTEGRGTASFELEYFIQRKRDCIARARPQPVRSR